MTASVAENRDRGLDVEDDACDRWPFQPVDDDRDHRNSWYDLEAVDDVNPGRSESPVVTAGTEIEVKSCYARYDVRAGRWWIRRESHERLVDAGGEYVLAVVDREAAAVARMVLVPARTVDALIDGAWWDAGDGGRVAEEYRQIAWTTILDDLDADDRGRSP